MEVLSSTWKFQHEGHLWPLEKHHLRHLQNGAKSTMALHLNIHFLSWSLSYNLGAVIFKTNESQAA